MIETRLTTALGIEMPFVLAPMSRWADADLAVAVSAAGGLGTFGAWASMGVNERYVRRQIATIRERTGRPFGAGFATQHLPASRANFEACLEERVPVILLSFADPTPYVPTIHDAGALVICQVQSFEAAQQAVDAGTDVLCIQGNEAGGHTGTQNLLPALVRALDSFPHIPVIASGGITSDRALAAVLAAGADGAWLGTALLAATEASFQPELAKAIVASDGADTVYSKTFDVIFDALDPSRAPWPPGIAMRSKRNATTDRWHEHEPELATAKAELNTLIEAITALDPDVFPVLYGEGAGAVSTVQPVAEIMANLLTGSLRRLNRFTPA